MEANDIAESLEADRREIRRLNVLNKQKLAKLYNFDERSDVMQS